jgi:hypothetical protein
LSFRYAKNDAVSQYEICAIHVHSTCIWLTNNTCPELELHELVPLADIKKTGLEIMKENDMICSARNARNKKAK